MRRPFPIGVVPRIFYGTSVETCPSADLRGYYPSQEGVGDVTAAFGGCLTMRSEQECASQETVALHFPCACSDDPLFLRRETLRRTAMQKTSLRYAALAGVAPLIPLARPRSAGLASVILASVVLGLAPLAAAGCLPEGPAPARCIEDRGRPCGPREAQDRLVHVGLRGGLQRRHGPAGQTRA